MKRGEENITASISLGRTGDERDVHGMPTRTVGGEIYRTDARYGDSQRNLERLPLGRDLVFSDTGGNGQVVAMTGNPDAGYRGTARIVLA